jgi:hypothetical protein
MAGLCVVLMGVFALMTVLVLAGSGNKARLDGSQGYPDAGPLPDMVAPGASTSTAHGAKHVTPSKPKTPGSLETVTGSAPILTGAASGSSASSVGNAATRTSTVVKSGSSGSKGSGGKAGNASSGGGKSTGSGGKSSGSGGGKSSGGGGSKPGGSTGGSGGSSGSHPGGSTGGTGGSHPGGSTGGTGGSHPGGSTGGSHPGGSTGGSTGSNTSADARAEFLRQLEQQLLAWRAQILAHEKEIAQRLAEQQAQHDYSRYVPHYAPRDTHPSHPAPSGHAYGRESDHYGRHGR